MDTRNWMRQYLAAKSVPGRIWIMTSAGVLFGVLAAHMNPKGLRLAGCLLAGVSACCLLIVLPGRAREYSQWWNTVEREGCAQKMLRDFQLAANYLSDELRIGRQWIYGKGANRAYCLERICGVYLCDVAGGRRLMVVGADGKARKLCWIPAGEKSEQELRRVLSVLRKMNPQIKISWEL